MHPKAWPFFSASSILQCSFHGWAIASLLMPRHVGVSLSVCWPLCLCVPASLCMSVCYGFIQSLHALRSSSSAAVGSSTDDDASASSFWPDIDRCCELMSGMGAGCWGVVGGGI